MKQALRISPEETSAKEVDILSIQRNGDLVLSIHMDGTIELGPALSMEEATQQAAKMLTDEIVRNLKRAEVIAA